MLIAAVGALALSCYALTASYKTLSANGNAAAPAEVTFISDPSLQIRVVNANYSSDTNNAVLSCTTGGTALSIAATNTSSTATTNVLSTTNGLAGSAVLLLEHGGSTYTATVSSFSHTGTNGLNGGTITNLYFAVTGAGGFGVATSVGDSVYVMTTPVTLPIGTSTNSLNGDALFVGNAGRPVRIVLTPAFVTNKLNAVTVRYE